jgi:hypothetical protein
VSLIDCFINLENFDKAFKTIDQRINKKKLLEQEDLIKIYNSKEEYAKSVKSQLISKLEKLQIFKNVEDSQKLKIYDRLTRHGIKLKQQYHNIPAHYQTNIYQDENNMYHFPVLIIYEEFNVTDYLQDVEENSLVSDILDVLLQDKLPWDKESKYNLNTVKCFYEISDYDNIMKKEVSYYYPLRNDDRLIDVLKHRKVYMNGFPVLLIVSQISNFYQHFIKNKVIIKRK